MNTVSLIIDGKEIRNRKGENLLWVALNNGIYIPNLCAIQEAIEPAASCRLCFVEIEGRNAPVTACTEPVKDGMVVKTKGEKALRLARTSAELLLASHPVDCARCYKNRSCELQKITAYLGIKLKTKRLRKIERSLPVDSSFLDFIYDPNKCILCGRCVWVCRERLGKNILGFAYRGFRRMVTTFENMSLAEAGCTGCAGCASVCPVGAMVIKKPNRHDV